MSGWDWGAFRKYLFNFYLLDGAWTTVWLSVAVMAIGLALGLGAALMRMSSHRVPRDLARFYIWLMRGTPLLVQLIIIYTGLPQLGIRLTVIQSALLGLGLNEGAYLAEIIRAGILSVPRGQFDAARAVGMPYWTMLRVVILPQAARVILPPLGNNFNGLLKTTSLASVISLEELLRRSQMLIQLEFKVLEIFVVAACYYLVMTSLWGMVQRRLEAHFGRPYGSSGEPPRRVIDRTLLEQDAR
ncbi:MAG TPA: amino acid ABC transporter permease [Methylomirabilota bacterium]|jgi:polar amino acid transport system permease protein|nr:amino acid ABC transporter permease [Methylomirabilota bacterium]